jgi:stage V sporulation protein G
VEITEVRIKLMEDASERLQAFCSITFDNSFVIRDLKIIDGANGPFVAMPSRKLTAHCPACGCKNHLRAAHCNQCGGRLSEDRLVKDEDGRAKLYADIAHPINSACREMIQQRVIQEFRLEVDRSKLPGYRSTYDDYDHDAEVAVPAEREQVRREAAARSTQVQPAEPQPRSPHKVPAQVPVQQSAPHAPHTRGAQSGAPRDNFGAGIF